MPRFTDTQSNFTGGQVAGSVQSRVDLDLHKKAFKKLDNCSVKITGGVTQRMGTDYIHIWDTGLGGRSQFRLFPFVFNDDQRYVMRVTTAGIAIRTVDGTNCTVSGTLPYNTWARIQNIRWTQLGDVMIMFNKEFVPKVIRRTGATAFSITDFAFGIEPYTSRKQCPMLPLRQDTLNLLVYTNGHYGNGVTVTGLPTGSFNSSDIGKQFEIEGVHMICTSVNTPAGTGFTNMVVNLYDKLDNLILVNVDTTYGPNYDVWNSYKLNEEIVEYAGTLGARPHPPATGTTNGFRGRVIDLQSQTSYIARSINEQPMVNGAFPYALESQVATKTLTHFNDTNHYRDNFFEEVYNNDNGWPSCGTFHEGRLWIAGGDPAPFHVFGSVAGDYFNFDVGEGDPDDAIVQTCTADNLSEILHLLSADDLQVYTNAGMFYAPSTEDLPLTPDNTRFVLQNKFGCSRTVAPKVFDSSTVFVQENNKNVRENAYNLQSTYHESIAISITGKDIIDEGTEIIDMTVLYGSNESEEQYLILTLSNWTSLAIFHSIRDENIRAWTPWRASGESPFWTRLAYAIAIGDELFGQVSRTTFEGTGPIYNVHAKFTFEHPMDLTAVATHVSGNTWNIPVEDRIMLGDSSDVSFTLGDAINGLHQYYLGKFTVDTSTGNVTLPLDAASSHVRAGIGFKAEIIPLPISKVFVDGDVQADVKRVSAVTMDLLNSAYVKVDDQPIGNIQDYADTGVAPKKYEGLYKFYLMGWDYNQDVVIVNDLPLPFHYRQVIREVEI